MPPAMTGVLRFLLVVVLGLLLVVLVLGLTLLFVVLVLLVLLPVPLIVLPGVLLRYRVLVGGVEPDEAGEVRQAQPGAAALGTPDGRWKETTPFVVPWHPPSSVFPVSSVSPRPLRPLRPRTPPRPRSRPPRCRTSRSPAGRAPPRCGRAAGRRGPPSGVRPGRRWRLSFSCCDSSSVTACGVRFSRFPAASVVPAHGTTAVSTSSRTDAAIDSASMPAACSCSAGDAEPGVVRTASRASRGTGRPSRNASRTASPRPPCG